MIIAIAIAIGVAIASIRSSVTCNCNCGRIGFPQDIQKVENHLDRKIVSLQCVRQETGNGKAAHPSEVFAHGTNMRTFPIDQGHVADCGCGVGFVVVVIVVVVAFDQHVEDVAISVDVTIGAKNLLVAGSGDLIEALPSNGLGLGFGATIRSIDIAIAIAFVKIGSENLFAHVHQRSSVLFVRFVEIRFGDFGVVE